ncbi:extensin-like [Haliotis rufescens]|uniref:extensin-like n=1 Tax=Haliotis rufescens TaxID=6454 RepID=UPI00201F5E42|nr:extensin-like [Haliotis rufescens]
MRDLSMSLPRELVSILEPLLAYRVGDYSLRTSYKSNSSTLSISFDLGQRKRPLVKAPAKTKPQMARAPAPKPPAPRPAQKKKGPPRVKKIPPPVLDMEIETSLPTTPPPPVAALDLVPLDSRGEEPFRSPEGSGQGRKKRKRRELPSPEPASRFTKLTGNFSQNSAIKLTPNKYTTVTSTPSTLTSPTHYSTSPNNASPHPGQPHPTTPSPGGMTKSKQPEI